jgi:uncharacterized membrane protein YgcG
MAVNRMIRTLSVLAVVLLYETAAQLPVALGQTPPVATGNPTEATPQSAEQLQSLVAPVALYPDSLVAMVLTASTFPDQVAVANYWLQQNKSLSGNALVQAADGQTWDPSVKALTAFPSVLENMAKNLNWTSALGEAYHNQQSEVMTAIQTCRAQAKAHGNLNSGSQITVTQQSPDVIVIQPTNPQVVYVPTYNPDVVFGYPYVVPGYVAPVYTGGDVAAAGLIGFTAGIAVGAMFHGGCCSWGWSSWNCGWHGTAVVYHGGAYYGNSGWHGGYYNGGYHASYGYANSYSHNTYNYNSYSHNSYASNSFTHNTADANSFNRSSASNSWAQHSGDTHSSAFSGTSGHSGGFGDSGGWASRADSSRGWGSMRSSGFGGGRFGGGGFGGGRFGGGGFRR